MHCPEVSTVWFGTESGAQNYVLRNINFFRDLGHFIFKILLNKFWTYAEKNVENHNPVGMPPKILDRVTFTQYPFLSILKTSKSSHFLGLRSADLSFRIGGQCQHMQDGQSGGTQKCKKIMLDY